MEWGQAMITDLLISIPEAHSHFRGLALSGEWHENPKPPMRVHSALLLWDLTPMECHLSRVVHRVLFNDKELPPTATVVQCSSIAITRGGQTAVVCEQPQEDIKAKAGRLWTKFLYS